MLNLTLTLTLVLAADQTPSVDRYGDPLPAGAVARLGTTRFRSNDRVRELDVSPDGRRIAAPADDTIIVWDADSGRELTRGDPILDSRSHPFTFLDVAFSPDGLTLATGTWNAIAGNVCPVVLFDARTGRESGRLPGHPGGVDRVAFAGGRLVSGGKKDQLFRVWDLATRQEVHRFPRQVKSYPDPFAVSPGGRLLAAGDTIHEWPRTNPLRVWDIVTGQEVLRLTDYLKDPRQCVYELVFAPDGRTLAARSSTVFYQIDVTTGKLVGTWDIPPNQLFGPLACSAAGPRVITVKDGALLVWDVAAGRAVAEPAREPLLMTNRSPVAQGFVALAGDFRVGVWDLATGRPRFPAGGHAAAIGGVIALPDGHTVATWDHGIIRFWDVATGRELRTLSRGENSGCLAWAPDGRSVAVVHNDRGIRFYDTATGREVRSLTPEEHPTIRAQFAHAMLFAPDGRTLVGLDGWSGSPGLRTWDLATGRLLRESAGVPGQSVGVFSPDGTALYMGHLDGTCRQWEAATDRPVRVLQGHPDFAPKIIPEMALWRHGPPRLGHEGLVTALAITPDGKRLVSGGDGTVRIWETATGQECALLEVPLAKAFAVSPTGTLLALTTNDPSREHRIELWDLPAGRKWTVLDGHRGRALSLAFTPDGRRLVSGSADTTALVWDVASLSRPRPAVRLPENERPALWADLADTDSTKADRAVRRWVVAPEDAVAFFRGQLAPAQRPSADTFARLLADLDSPQFARREQAQRSLQRLGPVVEPALREALTTAPSAEVRGRLETLLAGYAAEHWRIVRSIEVLEHLGTADARQLLQRLAEGAPDARLTREARASLERLRRTN